MGEAESGQKIVTSDNFAQPDPRILYFFGDAREWTRRCVEVKVHPIVPESVKALLEVARSAIAYGWFYYPLMTLGIEQCYRCLETAAKERCRRANIEVEAIQKNGQIRSHNFYHLIRALLKNNLISKEDSLRWEAARELRNDTAHPQGQHIQMPGQVVGQLNTTIQLVNRLFSQTQDCI